MLNELDRFKTSELPQHLRDKQKLEQIYSELEVKKKTKKNLMCFKFRIEMNFSRQILFGDTGQFRIEDDLTSSSLDRAWNLLLQAVSDRERLLRERQGTQSTMQDIISRLHHGIGLTNEKLDAILFRIEEAESRVKIIPPLKTKEIVDAIIYDLNALEAPIEGFFADVNSLKADRHPQANDYYQQ